MDLHECWSSGFFVVVVVFFNTCSLRLLFHEYSPDNIFEFLKSTNLSSKM